MSIFVFTISKDFLTHMAHLVTGFVLKGMEIGIAMRLGMGIAMGMKLGVFGCTFRGMIISNHCNV